MWTRRSKKKNVLKRFISFFPFFQWRIGSGMGLCLPERLWCVPNSLPRPGRKKKHSRTQTKVQEAEVHLDYKTLDGTVHTVVDKAQRIGDGQIKVVYGLTSRTLALKMASEQRVCVHLLMRFERMTVRNQFLFCVDPKHGTHTACLCYWVSWQCMEPIQRVFAIGFSCRLSQKIDTACLCYSVFCVLDVKDRSYVARKERVLFS